MLTLTLRGLERDGLVTRRVFPTIPPRVDHALTELGVSLWQLVESLGLWAQQNQAAIAAARRRFDQRDGMDTQRPDTPGDATTGRNAFDGSAAKSTMLMAQQISKPR